MFFLYIVSSSLCTFQMVKHLQIDMQCNRYWIGSIIYLIVLLYNLFEIIDFCFRFLLAGWGLSLECIDFGSVMIRWDLPWGSTQTCAGPQLLTPLTFWQLHFIHSALCIKSFLYWFPLMKVHKKCKCKKCIAVPKHLICNRRDHSLSHLPVVWTLRNLGMNFTHW